MKKQKFQKTESVSVRILHNIQWNRYVIAFSTVAFLFYCMASARPSVFHVISSPYRCLLYYCISLQLPLFSVPYKPISYLNASFIIAIFINTLQLHRRVHPSTQQNVNLSTCHRYRMPFCCSMPQVVL